MLLFISILIFFSAILILWMLLIGANKSKTDMEKYIEDNLQMQYLRDFSKQNHKC